MTLSILTSSKNNFIFDKTKEVAQGIVAPQDFLNKKGAEKLNNKFPVGVGIFNITSEEKDSLNLNNKELSLIKPFYSTEQLSRYYGTSKNNLWVIYTGSEFKNPNLMKMMPNLKNHLDKFNTVITSDNKPYGLHRARKESFFQGEKIISLRKCPQRPIFTFTDFDCYVSQTFFVIKTKRINQKYLTALLNSTLIAFWLKYKGKMQGKTYQVDKGPILEIPIYKPESQLQLLFSKVVDCILFAKANYMETKANAFESIIDGMIFELYFPDHMKEQKIDILQFVEKDIDEVMQGKEFETPNDTQKKQVLTELHNRWSDPDSEIVKRMNSFSEKSPEILKPILEG